MREGALIGPIIIAIGLVAAGISLAIVGALLETADGGTDLRLGRIETDTAALREDIGRLESELRDTRAELSRLKEDVALIGSRAPSAQAPAVPPRTPGAVTLDGLIDQEGEAGSPPETEALTEEMKLARARFNIGITQPRNATMLDLLGQPGSNYTQSCQGITNPALKTLVETRQVGPITVTMLKPALDSLQRIMDKLRATEPDIYAKVGTAGALCVRFIRGSSTSISNHSWGTAVDLTLQGELDGFADGGTQFGLLLLAELFNEEGWFWGATYNREDSMHFEVGEETLRRWKAEGLI